MGAPRSARAVGLLRAFVACTWLALCGALYAQVDDSGDFEVRSATNELVDGVYYVDALIRLRLPSDATEALHSGLPLTIRVEVEFLNRLRLWWDPVEHQLVQRFQLTYLPVTNRYVVLNINTMQRDSYESLALALDEIGELDDLPVVDAAVLDADRRYDVRIRAVLDKDELPGPVRLLAFWRRDWSIESNWLRWRLSEE